MADLTTLIAMLSNHVGGADNVAGGADGSCDGNAEGAAKGAAITIARGGRDPPDRGIGDPEAKSQRH